MRYRREFHMFSIRLKNYRIKNSLKSKEMAIKLDISESYYSLLEKGIRTPSKTILKNITQLTELPEEYWLYGINSNESKNISSFQSLNKAVTLIKDLNLPISSCDLFNEENEPIDTLAQLLINALRSDIDYILSSKKTNSDT